MDHRDPQTGEIIGAALEVFSQLGAGFLESVYQEALAMEFHERGIPNSREVVLDVHYKRQRLATSFRADFICFGDVIVELKAIKSISGIEEAQLLNYLKATGMERGLLLNFGAPRSEMKRMIHTPDR